MLGSIMQNKKEMEEKKIYRGKKTYPRPSFAVGVDERQPGPPAVELEAACGTCWAESRQNYSVVKAKVVQLLPVLGCFLVLLALQHWMRPAELPHETEVAVGIDGAAEAAM